MYKIKNYSKKFLSDESGMEFIQFAIIMLVVAAMAVAIYQLSDTAKNGINKAKNTTEKTFNESDNH